MEKQCKKHGLHEHILEPRGYWRCKRCRNDAVTEARRRRKRKLVELAIEKLGSSYFMEKSHGYKAWKAKAQK